MQYDAIVLGLGAAGSSLLYELAKQGSGTGKKFLGIDQFSLPHEQGSSHGESRMLRLATPKGDKLVQLAKRTLESYQEMEAKLGIKLYQRTGGMMIGAESQPNGLLQKLQRSALESKIEHSNLSAGQLVGTYAHLNVSSGLQAYFENDTGVLHPEKCIKAQLELAARSGAEIHTQEQLLSYAKQGEFILIKTNKGEYLTQKLILSAGPWMPTLLGKAHFNLLSVHRSTLHWYRVEPEYANKYKLDSFPITVWDMGEGNTILVFPSSEEYPDCIKVMYFQKETKLGTTPGAVNRIVTHEESQEVYDKYIKGYFLGVSPSCVKSVVCLYTVAPEQRFIVDYLPDFGDQVIAVSACARQGFKYALAISEAIAERLVFGRNTKTMDVFALFGGAFTTAAPLATARPAAGGCGAAHDGLMGDRNRLFGTIEFREPSSSHEPTDAEEAITSKVRAP